MTHIVRPTVPTVIIRLFDAFRANDAVALGEAFEPHALLVAHVEPRLLRLVGNSDPDKPVRVRGNLAISRFIAQEFAAMQVMHTEVHSEIRVGRGLSVICDYEAKLLATGRVIAARSAAFYTLSRNGRKVETCRAVCSYITPDWHHALN